MQTLWTLMCLIVVAGGAAGLPGPLAGQSTLVRDSVSSPGLATSRIGDHPVRRVLVYLPPSYRNSPARRYPVLYLLHGATSVPEEWLDGSYQGMNLQRTLDSLATAGAIPEFMVVMPDANNRLGAGWYANSPATGNWQDFVTRDLVRHIDREYHTDGRPTRRALVGHSMGGFGALAIGFAHPDIFGFLYAISPCCIGFTGRLAPTAPVWPELAALTRWQDAPERLGLVLGLAAALDGSRTHPRLFDEVPFTRTSDGRLISHPDVEARWLGRMPPHLAVAMVRRGDPQPTIFLEAGSEESGIREGVRVLRNTLDSLGIRYVHSVFAGGHIDRVRDRFTHHVLPTVGRWFARSPVGAT